MKRCELCGAIVAKCLKECSRCGFEFQAEIRSDSRDRALLERHAGMEPEQVRRELRDCRAKLAACLDNMAAKGLSPQELASLLDESLKSMQIPLVLGADDDLRLDGEEANFIGLITECLESADSGCARPVATGSAYVKLSNALACLGRQEEALSMVEKALLIKPKDRDALLCKARLLFGMRRFDSARKCLGKLIASGDSGDARYLSELIDQLDCQS